MATAPRVRLGDSGTVRTGDAVTAVGNAGGRGTPTVAAGAVTALQQSIQVEDQEAGRVESLTGLIEVDAQLEAGESGGPLFNAARKVVGMNTATSVGFTAAQTSTSRGYAIPINKAMGIVRAVLAKRGSSRIHVGATARLGVAVQTVPTPWAPGTGIPVVAVSDGTPAATAGIVAGDTITAIDGTAVTTASAVSKVMFVHHPGDTVTVTWTTAAGESRSASVTLASGPPA